MKKKWLAALVLVSALAVTAACGTKTSETDTSDADKGGEIITEFPNSSVTKLGNYKGVEVPVISTEVTEEEIQAEIDSLLAAYPETETVEGKTVIEEGDTVNIDYIGRLDGEPFEGGSSGEGGHNLTIGSGQFIDGFEDGLIGKEVGNTYELPLTFPDPYQNPEMAGKDVVFEVTVNEIVNFVDAEWNDEFVQKNTEYESTDAYVEAATEYYKSMKEQNALAEKEYNVFSAIIEDSEFVCDEEELEALKSSLREEHEYNASLYGMELADYISYYFGGMTEEEFDAEMQKQAEYQMKGRLLIDAITEAEGLALTEEEYQEGLEDLAAQYMAESAEAFEEQYGRETVEASLLYDKTIDFVVGNAVEV